MTSCWSSTTIYCRLHKFWWLDVFIIPVCRYVVIFGYWFTIIPNCACFAILQSPTCKAMGFKWGITLRILKCVSIITDNTKSNMIGRVKITSLMVWLIIIWCDISNYDNRRVRKLMGSELEQCLLTTVTWYSLCVHVWICAWL